MDVTGAWSQAGGAASFEAAGVWYAALPEEERPEGEEIGAAWHPVWGDRRQEIVFIGVDMAREELTRGLDACLLTPARDGRGAFRLEPGSRIPSRRGRRRENRRASAEPPQPPCPEAPVQAG